MLERAIPVYREAESAASASTLGLPADARLVVARAKVAGAEMVAEWRPWLFPEDDDG